MTKFCSASILYFCRTLSSTVILSWSRRIPQRLFLARMSQWQDNFPILCLSWRQGGKNLVAGVQVGREAASTCLLLTAVHWSTPQLSIGCRRTLLLGILSGIPLTSTPCLKRRYRSLAELKWLQTKITFRYGMGVGIRVWVLGCTVFHWEDVCLEAEMKDKKTLIFVSVEWSLLFSTSIWRCSISVLKTCIDQVSFLSCL